MHVFFMIFICKGIRCFNSFLKGFLFFQKVDKFLVSIHLLLDFRFT